MWGTGVGMSAVDQNTPTSGDGHAGAIARSDALPTAPDHTPLSLYVGVITSNPTGLSSLLCDLGKLATSASVKKLRIVVLDNASPEANLAATLRHAGELPVDLLIASVAQQCSDASSGAFGASLRERPAGRLDIATARTMLQKYLGTAMMPEPDAIGWILDDDMRVDDRARWYLSWLPMFRREGVDVLIGCSEGVSPNPALHGVQCRLFDLLHNMIWLQSLPASAPLPDRSSENFSSRTMYPEYYYDLSRRHVDHLRMPHWIEPATKGELVSSAYARLIEDAHGILRGAPFTRPLVTPMPPDPLAAARDSVNRGGNTFVLNPMALTATPNPVLRLGGREARRSDMLWAIINRHYRRMTIKTVAFPVVHVGTASSTSDLDIEKISAEVAGSALYAALLEFLGTRPHHRLDFSSAEAEMISRMMLQHRDRRLEDLRNSFGRITSLRASLGALALDRELTGLFSDLDRWCTPETLSRIWRGVLMTGSDEVAIFFRSLRTITDDYASSSPPLVPALRGGHGAESTC